MAEDSKKEALFNEVKGSLFEYLVGKKLSILCGEELTFTQSLDKNYLNVLSQQDRMVRLHYPQMISFLEEVSASAAQALIDHFKEKPKAIRLMGKFMNSTVSSEFFEADLLMTTSQRDIPVSLKLNKRNAFVNTKSGGIKSFFSLYFPFIDTSVQKEFSQLVDLEFSRMAIDLHAHHDMEFRGNFSDWVKRGFSELPGELGREERDILKAYYARIAKAMQIILEGGMRQDPNAFAESLYPLMGFGRRDILQVVCFHDFKGELKPSVEVHTLDEISSPSNRPIIKAFKETSSVELSIGDWTLQIRVKPMNKFTTTAIKINCSVKVRPKISSEA